MSRYAEVQARLRVEPRTWLVTGCAGFIGSNLAEALLRLGQRVVGLDNFATGHRRNLDDLLAGAGGDAAARFRFVEGDIRDPGTCAELCRGVDVVLHQAALGSVPRSIDDPVATNASNVDGFLHMLVAARDARVGRFVYAASSSTYGDHPALPKREDVIGRPLSPYAVSKYVNELYAGVFQRTYGLQTVGLRYFNVFGRRQDPAGAYAAVIPRWVAELLRGETSRIHGDGETSRDFCYVDDVVQANVLAALAGEEHTGEVYNVARGDRTTLRELHAIIREGLARRRPGAVLPPPEHGPFRPGDVRHSQADITRIRAGLGYEPAHTVAQGIEQALDWYVAKLQPGAHAAPELAHAAAAG